MFGFELNIFSIFFYSDRDNWFSSAIVDAI